VDNSDLLKALEEEDFDADEYDQIMQKMYGDDYYEVRFGGASLKPFDQQESLFNTCTP
jgi:KRI1-like family